MELVSLGSGSKGNSTYVQINGLHFLIDAGLSRTKIERNLLIEAGIDLDDISMVFITHSHSDHIKGLPVMLKKHRHIKYVFPPGVLEEVTQKLKLHIPEELRVEVGKHGLKGSVMNVEIDRLNHDVPCYAFKFFSKDGKGLYAHIADNGGIPFKKWKEYQGFKYYTIESNHDKTMQILSEKREPILKRRVLNFYGHTDNVHAIEMAIYVSTFATEGIMFNHLSDECNTPELAKETHDKFIEIFGEKEKFREIKTVYATQDDIVRLA